MLAVLANDSNDNKEKSTLEIKSITYCAGNIVIDITASKTINVDVAVSTTNGFVKAMLKNKILESGHNKLTIPALLRKSDVADIVTVSCKGERHSKLITVNSNE